MQVDMHKLMNTIFITIGVLRVLTDGYTQNCTLLLLLYCEYSLMDYGVSNFNNCPSMRNEVFILII